LKRTLKDKFPENTRFFIIDGDGGFDMDRAEQIWRHSGLTSDDIDDIKNRMIYWQPASFDEQHKTITDELPKLIKNKGYKPLLVVADPLTAIYRGIILRTKHQYRLATIGDYTGKLDLQLVTFRSIALKEDCPVTITSWEVSPLSYIKIGDEEPTPPEQKMIGGRAFGFLPKCIVELRRPKEGTPLREAYLCKHRSRREGGIVLFELWDGGVREFTGGR